MLNKNSSVDFDGNDNDDFQRTKERLRKFSNSDTEVRECFLRKERERKEEESVIMMMRKKEREEGIRLRTRRERVLGEIEERRRGRIVDENDEENLVGLRCL